MNTIDKRNQDGFTLIELMIVVAILAILMAIAIPAYQDYTIRSQVSEGMNLTGGARTAVAEFWTDRGSFPTNNASAGLAASGSILGEYVSDVKVAGGVITAKFASGAENAAISGKTLVLSPIAAGGSIEWSCDGGNVDNRYLPSRCRN
jgi:type IV pilus assembly protein PilA